MFTSILNTSFDLYSNEITSSTAIGGQIRTLTLKQATIPCYFTYLTGAEKNLYGKRNIKADYRLFADLLDIKSTDIVLVDSKYYNVSFINQSGLQLDHHLELLLIAVKSPQDIALESGWTWGEQNPSPEIAESWETWTYLNSTTEARNTGAWGELELRSMENFVSPVKDTGDLATKYITLSYDDYDICTHNSGKIIWWRGSDTSFNQSDVLPAWNFYSGSFCTTYRYLQIKCGIY